MDKKCHADEYMKTKEISYFPDEFMKRKEIIEKKQV